ncbi:odorant receptor 82a-like isoform X2 [Megalopta genalis]|uniref:odorant receptor 82a-like isoform X2 n=1 Tax=Megalopta genalis TaxID=115081 RepID=UPI003FD631B5
MSKREPILSNSLQKENDYVEHVNLSIELNRWLLKPIGVWPHSNNISKSKMCFDWLINLICYFLISFLFAPCSLYVWLEGEVFYDKLKHYGPLIFCIMAYLKYYSLMVHAADIRKCIKCIEWDWRNVQHSEDRAIMIGNAYFGRRLVKICSFFMFSGFAFYNIAVPIKIGKIPMESGNGSFLPLGFPVSRLIIDARHSPVNEIFFTLQLFGALLIHGVGAAACSLAAAFAVHACGQMQVLMCWMGYLVDGRFDMSKTTNGRLAMIVGQHIRIQTFLNLMEKALTQISLVECFGCTVDICLAGYYVIVASRTKDMTSVVTYAVILLSLVFNIFIFCYIGELVAEECRKVGATSYMIDWYRLPEKSKLGVVLIMLMSNSSVKLTAGSIIKLSLSSFATVIKTSVAFLNMLRTLTE